MKKAYFCFIVFSSILVLSGCTSTLNVLPRSSDQSVLYVLRVDAPKSKKDLVKVFLNQTEVTELLADEYKALHVNPGSYDIEFIVHKPDGSKETATNFTAQIEPNTVKLCSIRYVMGWKDPRRFIDGKNTSVFKRFIFTGELDLTNTVSPK
jgi:hypothetical protein